MANDQIVELASRIGGVEGKLGALVETFAEHRKENHEDHTAVMAVLCRMEEKLDLKADKTTVSDMEKDLRINTVFRKVAVWVLVVSAGAFITSYIGAIIAKAHGL